MNYQVFSPLIIVLTLGHGFTVAEPVSFSKQIAPILQAKCVVCHGEKLAESDYRLDTFSKLLRTESGEAIVPGDVSQSILYERLVTSDSDLRMPAEADPLSTEQISLIRRWIESGAAFDGASPSTPLAELVPARTHPTPPDHYPAALPLSAIAMSRSGALIWTSGYHEILEWNMDGKLLRRMQDQGERTYSLDQHPRKPWLLSASGTPGESGEVRIFHIDSGKVQRIVSRADEVYLDAKFSPDGRRMALAHPDGSVRILSTETWATEQHLLGHSGPVTALEWHADGVRLATASLDHTAKVFDVVEGKSLATFTGHTEAVYDLSFVSESEIVSCCVDGSLLRWTIKDGRKQAAILTGNDRLMSITVDNEFYVVTGAHSVYRFHRTSHKELARFQVAEWCIASATRPNSPIVVLGSQSGRALVLPITPTKNLSNFLAKP